MPKAPCTCRPCYYGLARPCEKQAGVRCHAGQDGDCVWEGCPQLRDGEPAKSGRHCPLDVGDDDEF